MIGWGQTPRAFARARPLPQIFRETPLPLRPTHPFGYVRESLTLKASLVSHDPLILVKTQFVSISDTARCIRPVTFMSNMLYACSILYKMQLPFVLTFNKCDVLSCKFVRDVWMKDQSAFSEVGLFHNEPWRFIRTCLCARRSY